MITILINGVEVTMPIDAEIITYSAGYFKLPDIEIVTSIYKQTKELEEQPF